MTLSDRFAVAAGSVTGRSHRLAERDGQDGCATLATGQVVAAIVTDGCSSGRASEIGARVGARWLAAIVERRFGAALEAGPGPTEAPEQIARAVTRELVLFLGVLARSLHPAGELDAGHVGDALLFGFLAAVVTPRDAIVFGVGDGLVLAGRDVTVLDPGPSNAPPYAAYALLGRAIEPRVHFVGRTEDVAALAIATDGVEPAAELALLAETPRIENNPSLLEKRLRVLATERRFADDATVAVIRRKERAS